MTFARFDCVIYINTAMLEKKTLEKIFLANKNVFLRKIFEV